MKAASEPGQGRGAILVRFGVYQLNLTAGELRKNGTRLKLPAQSFRILSYLIEHPGEVVTREQLRHTLWGDDTFVDFDRCLNAAVNRLRDTLNDSAGTPRFIETLPRKGYRFLASVERLGEVTAEQNEDAGPPTLETAPPSPPGTRSYRRVAIAAGVALVLAGLSLRFFGNTRPSVGGPPEVVALTAHPGSELTPAYSPDGTQIAFAWKDPERPDFDIYTQRVGSNIPARLSEGPAEDFGPGYSPDGKRIAFYRRSGDGAAIHIGLPDARRVTRLTGLHVGPAAPDSSHGAGQRLESVSWSPDGKRVAHIDRSTPDAPFSIFLFTLETRIREHLTWPQAGSSGDGSPVFSPDGRSLAFVRGGSGDSGDIWVQSLEGGAPRRLTQDNASIRGLAWKRDGSAIVFSSDRGSEPQLWSVPVTGGGPERLASVREPASYPAIPLQAAGLAFVRWSGHSEIWSTGLASSESTASRVPLPRARLDNVRVSPDGSRIAYSADNTGMREIWTSGVGGENPVRLTSLRAVTGSPQWSPDGKQIAFDSAARGSWDAYVVDVSKGDVRLLTPHDGADVRPTWSADGRWIYFGSDRSGAMQIWRLPSAGGVPSQVTRNGGYEAIEAPDRRSVYYIRQGVPGLWRVPVEGGEEVRVIPDLQWNHLRNWTLGPEGIYYTSSGERTVSLRYYAYSGGAARDVLSFGPVGIQNSGLCLSRDGRRVFYARHSRFETDIAGLRSVE